jgi:hypothetical protein
MDTPGFENENKQKPEITKEIEGASSTATPKSAARDLLAAMLHDRYNELM